MGSSTTSVILYLHMRYYFLYLSLTSLLKQKLGPATLSLECRTENHEQIDINNLIATVDINNLINSGYKQAI